MMNTATDEKETCCRLPQLPNIFQIRGALQLLAETHYSAMPHSIHTARLALKLFDETLQIHELQRQDRIELACAALLHDIGAGISNYNHHKISRDLINERFWILEPESRRRTALIARYHRKELPANSHKDFMKLSRTERKSVQICIACLRIADGLDRTHRALVNDLSAEIRPGSVKLFIQFLLYGGSELHSAIRKSDGFKAFFGRNVEFVPYEVGYELGMTG